MKIDVGRSGRLTTGLLIELKVQLSETGVSQTELNERIGLGAGYISRMLVHPDTHAPNLAVLIQCARVLGLNPWEFLEAGARRADGL